MEMVMNKFEQTKSLPVIQEENILVLFKSVALEAYRTKLKSMTIE
jgi:CIC family chloride channel protein